MRARGGVVLAPPAGWEEAPHWALSIDEVYAALCPQAEEGSAVSLGLTCRLLCETLRRLTVEAYASVAPRLLGRRPRGAAHLRARWERFAACQEEVDAALLGATEGGQVGTVCWLASAGGIPPAFPVPQGALLGASLETLVKQEITCEMMKVLVRACPLESTKVAFVEACAAGKLGIAQIAYRRAAEKRCASARSDNMDLLKKGVAATGERSCYLHIVTWAQGLLRVLEQRRY
jgi:hypothetical protein